MWICYVVFQTLFIINIKGYKAICQEILLYNLSTVKLYGFHNHDNLMINSLKCHFS
jgi:hypothetical protein